MRIQYTTLLIYLFIFKLIAILIHLFYLFILLCFSIYAGTVQMCENRNYLHNFAHVMKQRYTLCIYGTARR